MLVQHSAGGYEVEFVSFDLAMAGLPPNAFIVTDDNVKKLWGKRFPPRPVFTFEPGEGSKTLATYGELLEWLAVEGADRSSAIVAIGGGVVGDLAGFAAATYMRGISCIQVPTTLLAQVDSSVGGKVGVDLESGKNLAGAFYPPARVSVAVETLSTLPARQLKNGMAEVWKYAFIQVPSLADQLRQDRNWEQIVTRCIEIKAAVVAEDEFDRTGSRAILNFGHTVGHALETLDGYNNLLHGEAIAIGMVAEARLGEALGITIQGTAEQVSANLQNEGLPVSSKLLRRPSELVEIMARDKKAESGELAFSLLVELGACKLVKGVPRSEVEAVLQAI